MKKEILIAEFEKTHTEILHSQILFLLHRGYKINLWLNEEADFEDVYDGKVNIVKSKTEISSLNLKLLYKVLRFIKQHNIEKIILNTAHGLLIRNLCFILLNKKVEVTGVLHQAHKLIKSSTQSIISKKVKKNFVLNDYVKDFVLKETKGKYKVESFYPIYFNKLSDVKYKPNYKIIITVPGNVIQLRKDYVFLIKNLLKLEDEIRDNFQFIILGRATDKESPEMLQMIGENNISEDFVKIYKEYVSEEEFSEVVQNSDFIMPLIHPTGHSYNEYLSTEISGAFNTAFGYHKPLLMYESFSKFEDFKKFSVFYNESNFLHILKNLTEKNMTTELKKRYENYPKFDFNFQANKYINFIENH
ncbi:MAG: hypothetical protein JSS63_11500 [Bacteroidetes bacterium]|mgnify:CR=1 FL=1|nr:hypothetical protein [Bacteroidota bacterium]